MLDIATPLQPVDDPALWTREQMAAAPDWLHVLSAAELAELDKLVAKLDDEIADILDITRPRAAFARLAPVLADIRNRLLNGRGVAVLRGVPVERYTRRQAAIAFWCLGLHIGDPVSQNALGHLLGHVTDLGDTSFDNPQNRGYQTHDALPFHSDFTDVVGLLCLHPARAGGESLVTSSIAIHNEMLRRDPHLVEVLTQQIYRDRRGEIPAGKDPWYQRPVFAYHEGRLTTCWTRGYILSARRFEELPPPSETLIAALDLFEELAFELAFAMDFRQGDIQLLHNHVVVHSRTRYEDWPEPERARHLLRLWLATPGGRPLPDCYAELYGDLRPGDRPAGGITIPGTTPKAPLDAQ
jgi:hypothetical protein